KLAEVSTLPASVIHNPFDMTVDGAVHYGRIVEVLAASGDFDLLVSQGQPKRSFEAPLAEGDVDLGQQFREFNSAALFGAADASGLFATYLETSDHQPGVGVFDYEGPNGAHWVLGRNGVQAISNAIDYGRLRRRIQSRESSPRYDVARESLPDLSGEAGSLSETASKQLLSAYGVPVTADVLATTAEDAAAASERIGFPVVLKVVADNVAHKSDAGGVLLGLETAAAVADGFARIQTSVREHVPNARIEGVIVARQAVGGAEFIAGITSDPNLGPVVVAGLGGIYVEVLKDVVLIRPPFSAAEAAEALEKLKSWPILAGARGGAALDVEAFADTLARLGQLALDARGTLIELDVNPLFVFPRGGGVLAADALAVVTTESEENG
ncbi:MAG: acetate--CoA ligase family protein, partial [Aeromicrobium sp.]